MYVYYYESDGSLYAQACDPIAELTNLLNNTIDHRLEEDDITSDKVDYLKSIIHHLPAILVEAQELERTLEFATADDEIRLYVRVDALGHYDIDFINDPGSDVFIARISWVEPLH